MVVERRSATKVSDFTKRRGHGSLALMCTPGLRSFESMTGAVDGTHLRYLHQVAAFGERGMSAHRQMMSAVWTKVLVLSATATSTLTIGNSA